MANIKLPRLLFFGMAGQFSVIPLRELLAEGVEIEAAIMPGRGRDRSGFPRQVEPPVSPGLILNLESEPNVIHLAWEHQLPVWEAASLSDGQTLSLLADFQPDIIVIACFPYLFPPALLELPRYGCLNLHPSLLPAYRGPAPLFWIARQDERRSGVTLHLLDEGIDTGDIVAQATFDRPDGLSEAQLEQQAATAGATLLLQTLQQLQQGQALPRRPQPEAGASYHPWPCETDFIITPDWSARRAFNFLQGATGWPLVIQIGEHTFPIRTALSYSTDHSLDQPYILLGDELWVQFQPGVLRTKILQAKNQAKNNVGQA